MAVGVDGTMGRPMICEGQGFQILVRRTLRDIFRRVPTITLEVKVIVYESLFSIFYISLNIWLTFLSNKFSGCIIFALSIMFQTANKIL